MFNLLKQCAEVRTQQVSMRVAPHTNLPSPRDPRSRIAACQGQPPLRIHKQRVRSQSFTVHLGYSALFLKTEKNNTMNLRNIIVVLQRNLSLEFPFYTSMHKKAYKIEIFVYAIQDKIQKNPSNQENGMLHLLSFQIKPAEFCA